MFGRGRRRKERKRRDEDQKLMRAIQESRRTAAKEDIRRRNREQLQRALEASLRTSAERGDSKHRKPSQRKKRYGSIRLITAPVGDDSKHDQGLSGYSDWDSLSRNVIRITVDPARQNANWKLNDELKKVVNATDIIAIDANYFREKEDDAFYVSDNGEIAPIRLRGVHDLREFANNARRVTNCVAIPAIPIDEKLREIANKTEDWVKTYEKLCKETKDRRACERAERYRNVSKSIESKFQYSVKKIFPYKKSLYVNAQNRNEDTIVYNLYCKRK